MLTVIVLKKNRQQLVEILNRRIKTKILKKGVICLIQTKTHKITTNNYKKI